MAPRSLFKNYGDGSKQRPRLDDANLLQQTTIEYLASMEGGSVFFRENPPRAVASLEPCELELNKIIGMGEFGVVVEVKSVSLHTSSTDSNASCCPSFVECPVDISVTSTTRDAFMRGSQSCSALHSMWSHYNTAKKPALSVCNTTNSPTWTLEEQQKLRAHLSSRVNRRNASSRYAAKQLRKDLYLKKKTEAAKDLGREAKFLSCLHHPNIVSLRATVSRPGHADFMILLDYLSNPLSEQMVQWKEQEMTCANFLIPWQSQQQIQQQAAILSARLLALHDVAQGMRYLHQKFVLFRDLKPENVASNHHLAHQLFDFGLAKELKPADLVVGKSDEYHLTGLTGTLRIMAPEVIQCQPYGLPADVFSFGIVSWEVFRGGQNQLTAMEVSQQNQRPEFPSNETPLEDLIQRCWAANTNDRLTFDDICEELQYRLSGLDKEHNLDQTSPSSISRRSEYLRRLSQESSEADPVFYVK